MPILQGIRKNALVRHSCVSCVQDAIPQSREVGTVPWSIAETSSTQLGKAVVEQEDLCLRKIVKAIIHNDWTKCNDNIKQTLNFNVLGARASAGKGRGSASMSDPVSSGTSETPSAVSLALVPLTPDDSMHLACGGAQANLRSLHYICNITG